MPYFEAVVVKEDIKFNHNGLLFLIIIIIKLVLEEFFK